MASLLRHILYILIYNQKGIFRGTFPATKTFQKKIIELNNSFADCFHPIKNELFIATEVQSLLNAIQSKKNALLLGAPGVGKSGCIQALINELSKKDIPYLSLNLSVHPPHSSSTHYGSELGFPCSPVMCLESIIPQNSYGILILDQLDSLRWTAAHSPDALSVCKQMIKEAHALSDDTSKSIYIVMASRTFDFENDAELSELCSSSKFAEWEYIALSHWSVEKVKEIIGESIYLSLFPRTQKLLQIPSNLYIWQHLDEVTKVIPIKSTEELIAAWLNQIYEHAKVRGLDALLVENLFITICKFSQKSAKILRSELGNAINDLIDFGISEGVLYSDAKSICFVHQCIEDHFNVQLYVEAVCHEGKPVSDVLPSYNRQLPNERIRLQLFWQFLLEKDEEQFLDKGSEFLSSPNVRYYYKCTFWEALGQKESPFEIDFQLIAKYWHDPQWKNFIYNSVFLSHLGFIKKYVEYKFSENWLEPQSLRLLLSAVSLDPQFVFLSLQPYMYKDMETDEKLCQIFCSSLSTIPDTAFEFVLRCINKYPEMSASSYEFIPLTSTHPNRALQYLKVLFHLITSIKKDVSIDSKFFSLAQSVPIKVIEFFVPTIHQLIGSATPNYFSTGEWSERFSTISSKRFFFTLVEKSFEVLSKSNETYLLQFIEKHINSATWLENELIFKLLLMLPDSTPELAYQWLISLFPSHLFEYTSAKDFETDYAFEAISRFSKFWSDEQIKTLEAKIVSYHNPNEFEIAKSRFDFCRSGKGYAYFPYWGNLQEALLPALDKNRLQPQTVTLQGVLARRSKISGGKSHYSKPFVGAAHFISSPISDHSQLLSNNAWIRLLTYNVFSTQTKSRWRDDYHESSPEMYARSFESVMKKEPERFLQIANALPTSIDPHYIASIFSILTQKCVYSALDFRSILSIVERFSRNFTSSTDYSVVSSFCWMLRELSVFPWTNDIYTRLSFLAKRHINPAPDGYNVTIDNDKAHRSVESLRSNSLNCVRGAAFLSIAQIIESHNDTLSIFEDAILSGMEDANPAVRYNLVNCLAALINVGIESAYQYWNSLLQKDIRILAHPLSPYFCIHNYSKQKDLIQSSIIQALTSDDEKLSEAAALAIVCIYLYDNDMDEVLYSITDNENQLNIILQQLYWVLKDDESSPKERAHEALFRLLSHAKVVPSQIIYQFFDKKSHAGFNAEIANILIEKVPLDRDSWHIIDYFIALDSDRFSSQKSLAYVLCKRLCSDSSDHRLYSSDKLSMLLLGFLDIPGLCEEERSKYLALFDAAFQSNIFAMRKLLEETQQ